MGIAGKIHPSMTGLLLRSYLNQWCVSMSVWKCVIRARPILMGTQWCRQRHEVCKNC